MERVRQLITGSKPVKKTLIRDSKGRPYYLTKLPFRYKYPAVFAIGGGTLAFLITFSGFIYNSLIRDNSQLPPDAFLWPQEQATGVTHVERVREYYQNRRAKKE